MALAEFGPQHAAWVRRRAAERGKVTVGVLDPGTSSAFACATLAHPGLEEVPGTFYCAHLDVRNKGGDYESRMQMLARAVLMDPMVPEAGFLLFERQFKDNVLATQGFLHGVLAAATASASLPGARPRGGEWLDAETGMPTRFGLLSARAKGETIRRVLGRPKVGKEELKAAACEAAAALRPGCLPKEAKKDDVADVVCHLHWVLGALQEAARGGAGAEGGRGGEAPPPRSCGACGRPATWGVGGVATTCKAHRRGGDAKYVPPARRAKENAEGGGDQDHGATGAGAGGGAHRRPGAEAKARGVRTGPARVL
jgi:hypothetical protein